MTNPSISDFDPVAEMQKAVDVVNTSAHPSNKIAATLFGTDDKGRHFSISHTNYWPDPIAEKIGVGHKIGSSSGTIHAETACILAAPMTMGAKICITDPFCPNCAKNMAEAGITHIYIDHKGLDKEWITENQDAFNAMSLRICARAGINVYEVSRKARTIIPIYEVPADYKPLHENPVTITPVNGQTAENFKAYIAAAETEQTGHEFAICLAENKEGRPVLMTARRHAAIGYSRNVPESMEDKQGKYSFIVQPINRLLMNAPRHSLKIIDGCIYSSRVPTSREQVNMIGAGLTSLIIGDREKARDESAFAAMKQLAAAKILSYREKAR